MSKKNDGPKLKSDSKKDDQKKADQIIKDYQEMGKISATDLDEFFDENFLEAHAMMMTRA